MTEIGEFNAGTVVKMGTFEEIVKCYKIVTIMVKSSILKYFRFLLSVAVTTDFSLWSMSKIQAI